MTGDVVVGDGGSLEKKTAAIRSAGTSKLQVIADFDGTLTKYWNDGCRGQSMYRLQKINCFFPFDYCDFLDLI